jgi:hypothetical protein
MRRTVPFVSLVVAVVLAVAPAASAVTVVTESVPRLELAPVEKACGGMEVVATDRTDLSATSTYDDRTLLSRRISGRQVTLFDRVGSGGGASISIETLGTRTITRNADGTYTLLYRGTGYWYDDGNLSGTAQLVRFTGTVRSVGEYDAGTFTFSPIETTITGVTASICDMLVNGLKARH